MPGLIVSGATELTLPFPWKPGEHLAIIGDTGTGKTFLASLLLQSRKHLIALKSKADRTTIDAQKTVKLDRDLAQLRYTRFVLYPDYDGQQLEFARALERAWVEGGWTVYLDELPYLTGLKLTPFIDRLLTQGRSKDLTIVSGMQRPVGVTRNAIAQSTHVICFIQEGRDVKTVVEATSPKLKDVLPELAPHEFVWYYRPKRSYWRGYAQNLLRGQPTE